MNARSSTLTTAALFALLGALSLGCGDKDVDSDTGGLGGEAGGGEDGDGGMDGTDDGTDGGDTGEPVPVQASISGTVTVNLYGTDSDGERVEQSWEDSAYYDSEAGEVAFPFGDIFIGAYALNDMGQEVYAGTLVIGEPTTTQPYTLDLELDAESELYIYAAVDRHQDGVVGSDDPTGVYPAKVPVVDGDAITGIDITILSAPYGEGGSDCSRVGISGDVEIKVQYGSGAVKVMLVDTAGNGPYHSTTASVSAVGGGAEGSYALSSCADYGDMAIVGAWDSNNNGMIDPDDTWGAYASVPGENGNPVLVGNADITGKTVEIPLGNGPGVRVVPFVTLNGNIGVQDGTLSGLGADVYATALKYRPSSGFDIGTTTNAYDTDTFLAADLASSGSVTEPYSLIVPANTYVYLWGYADTDFDGKVNESGEPVASADTSEDNGRIETGAESTAGLDLDLGLAGG